MSEDGRSSEHKPTRPVSPIVRYYEGELPATRCASELRRQEVWTDSRDLQSLLPRLSELDSDLAKTWTLVKGEARRAEPVSALRRWLHMVVRAQGTRDDDARHARHVVEDVLPESAPLKGKAPKRTTYLLKLTILDLRWQRDLSVEHVVRALVNHFVNARESTDALERHALAFLLLLGNTSQLRSVSRTLAWMTRQSAAQADELATTRRDLENVQRQNGELATAVRGLNERVSELDIGLEAAYERIRVLEGELAQARDSAVLRLHHLVGHVSGAVNGRINPLLQQATDALRMTDPQVRAANEFVETAQSSILELIRWLAAESTSERPTA